MAKIVPIAPGTLGPTQITVGMIEVADKKKELTALKAPDQVSFLQAHVIPAVLGPNKRHFLTDHHHLGRAALECGIAVVFCEVQDDLSSLAIGPFWDKMEENAWVHPLDEHGTRHVYSKLPDHLEQLVDDVYRSLSGYVRNAGGYDKTFEAFSEFIWADFFRRNVAVELVTTDFARAVQAAIPLARSLRAKRLPGFKGS